MQLTILCVDSISMTIVRRILIILLIGLFTCNTPQDKKQEITIEDRVPYPKTVLSPLFDSLRPAIQTFIIKGNRDTLIVGKNGTTLAILKNTFVNYQGQVATKVSINLVEVNSIAEIIKANLQTTSGDKILQTGGMFFLDAKESSKSLVVAEGKSIYVEVRSNSKDPRMKIFDGRFDDKGRIDWTTTDNLASDLIPIPLSLVNFNKCDLECGLSKNQTDNLLNPRFENTYIATREFEDRCCTMMYATCPQSNNLSQKLLNIYTANIDKPLFYSDSLVIDYLAHNLKDKIDTTKEFNFDDTGWVTYMYKFFIELKEQRLTNAVNFEKLGISERTTTEELISRGYSENEAEKFIAYFKVREQIVKYRESEKQASQLAYYSFGINKLGWINIDRFIDEKVTEPSTFLVHVKSKDTLDFISISLVIPSYNVVISSIYNDGNLYSFTNKDDGYKNLPVGQDAIIVGFSYKANKPYFGKQKIKIPKDGQIDLTLIVSTEKTIEKNINGLMD